MTEEQLHQYREKLRLGLIPGGDKTLQYGFRNGWNEGVGFAMRHFEAIVGKANNKGESA